MSAPALRRGPGQRLRRAWWRQYRLPPRRDESWPDPAESGIALLEASLLPSSTRTTVRGWAAEKDQFPNRDRPKASPLASPQQPMDHVFLRGQIHQKPFGRSPRGHGSAIRFYRHRRAADPSSFFKSLLRRRILLWVVGARLQSRQAELVQ